MKATFKPALSRFDSKKSKGGSILRKNTNEDPAKRNLSMRSTQQHSTGTGIREFSIESKQERTDKNSDMELFGESSGRLKTLRSDHRHSLQNQLDNILDIVNQEKTAIRETMKKMNEKTERYKQLYHEEQNKSKKQGEFSEEGKELYDKFVVILQQMNINPSLILPPRQKEAPSVETREAPSVETKEGFKEMEKEEIIRVQRFLIKKLIKKLEEE